MKLSSPKTDCRKRAESDNVLLGKRSAVLETGQKVEEGDIMIIWTWGNPSVVILAVVQNFKPALDPPAFKMSLDCMHSAEMRSEQDIFLADKCSCLVTVGLKFWKPVTTKTAPDLLPGFFFCEP